MSEIKKIILDTDIGPDCDDCGALAILDAYYKAGKIDLLGVTHCTSDLLGADVIAAIHQHFGVTTPIGQTTRQGFLADLTKYTGPVSAKYRETNPPAETEPAVDLLRRLLRDNRDVTIVFIGPLNNMGDLLASGGDAISPMSGVELIRQSVREVICMGGNFRNFSHGEWNIEQDVPAAQRMSEECPVPIIYCGFEAGENVMTGASLEACDESNPVRLSYYHYTNGSFRRNSWDLVTVYYAVEPDDPCWQLSDEVQIRFNNDATAVVKTGVGAKYVVYSDERALEEILNDIICQ